MQIHTYIIYTHTHTFLARAQKNFWKDIKMGGMLRGSSSLPQFNIHYCFCKVAYIIIFIHPASSLKVGYTRRRCSSPPLCSFAFHGFGYLRLSAIWKQTLFLLMYHQKVKSSLTLHHNTYFSHTPSHHVDILSSHIITRRVNAAQ